MKAIRWLLKLVLVIMTLPLILAVWLIKWFVSRSIMDVLWFSLWNKAE